MSNLDPFTQKLLERTQARKEARKKLHHVTTEVKRSPLKNLVNNEVIRESVNLKSPQKRQSTEECNSSFEKKIKSNVADVSPQKKVGSSLKNRLAYLNDEISERCGSDFEEQRKMDEAEEMRQQRNKERLKQQEGDRARKIQERIFGKNHDLSVKHNQIAKKVPVKTEPKPMFKSKVDSEIVRPTGALKSLQTTGLSAVASVGDKKSIFEDKMRTERMARQKEIEAEKRLRHKTPGSVSKMKTTAESKVNKTANLVSPVKHVVVGKSLPEKVNSPMKKVEQMRKQMSEVKTVQREKESMDVCEDDNLDVTIADVSPTKKCIDTPKEFEPLKSCSDVDMRDETKNFTGDISSPQPVDYTEDTPNFTGDTPNATEYTQPPPAEDLISDSKVFDISSIMKTAHADQRYGKTERATPLRCSTMKVQCDVPFMKPLLDNDVTPVLDEEEELSDFAKQLQTKKNDIVQAEQHKKLAALDIKSSPVKKTPAKPPRTERHSADLPSSYAEFLSEEKTAQEVVDNVATEKEIPTVESNKRKKMRRSASFSAGQNTSPTKPASGSSKHDRLKHNALLSFDKPDIEFSKRDKIQNLLEEAAYQQNIVLQTSQALNVAENSNEDKRGTPEVIEGERLLLLATEKRTVCLEQVREIKEGNDDAIEATLNESRPCNAALALTDIKLPLHPDFVTALKAGRMDLGVFHFVVIFTCGSQNVYSTKVVSCFDTIESYSLKLDSNILMSKVPHDFKVTVRVFGLHTKKTNDPTSKLKKTNSSNQSPGNLKSLFSKKNKDDDYSNCASPQTVFRTSNFKLVGETKISLDLMGNGGKYLLLKVPSNCPIDGMVHMRVGCKPEFTASATGFLTVLEDVGGYTAWNRRWCDLKNNKICYWRYPDDQENKDALGNIDLRLCVTKVVGLLSRDKCARPHTFELELKRAFQTGDTTDLITTVSGKSVYTKYWICADTKEDRELWMSTINKQLSDSRAWLSRRSASKAKPVAV